MYFYKNIQQLFTPETAKPGFEKIQTDFVSTQQVNKGRGRLEIRTLTTSEMLNSYSTWPGLAQVYWNVTSNGGEMALAIAPPLRSNLASPV